MIGLSGLAALLACLGAAPGCAGGPADVSENTARPGAAPVSIDMTGTLRDLDPAIGYACGQHDIAILEKPKADAADPYVRTYQLITVVDEPVTLTVRLPKDAPVIDQPPGLAVQLMPSGEPLKIEASMQIGFGYPDRERAFLTTLRDRLAALKRGDGIAKRGG